MNNKVTIIIPFNALNPYVFESIQGCLQLDYLRFLIVLLPDASIHLPKKFKDKKIKICVTGKENISVKRNLGMAKYPDTDYYAFIDSDAYPTRDWLSNAIKALSQDINLWAAGGPNLCPPTDPLLQKAAGNALKSFLVLGSKTFHKKIAPNRYCEMLPTCNLIVKNEAVKKIGYFNESLDCAEDTEFCNRIQEQHKKIFFDNKVIVYHHNRTLYSPFIIQRIIRGFFSFKLLKENFCIANLFYAIPALFVLFLIIGVGLSIFYPLIRMGWLFIVGIYLLAILVETFRYSEKLCEFPLTFLAILLGNLLPGVGSLIDLLGLEIDVKRLFNNYNKS